MTRTAHKKTSPIGERKEQLLLDIARFAGAGAVAEYRAVLERMTEKQLYAVEMLAYCAATRTDDERKQEAKKSVKAAAMWRGKRRA